MIIARTFLKNARVPILRPSLRSTSRCLSTTSRSSAAQPIGVKASLLAKSDPSFVPKQSIFKEFDLTGRIAVVSGANRGIGLEISQALAEAGANVHCFDLPQTPSESWEAAAEYVSRLSHPTARLNYASLDVTDQEATWAQVEKAAKDSGDRLDVCVAAAGIVQSANCLDFPAKVFSKEVNVDVNGVFYFAQASGRQMAKSERGGSIILIASGAGTSGAKGMTFVAYCTSKAGVIQMGRSMACELGPKKIRVNSLSPGYVKTEMTGHFLDANPQIEAEWASQNPLGRLAQPEEMRGAAVWLASDASTFCTGADIQVTGGHTAW